LEWSYTDTVMRPDVPGRLHVRGQLLPVEHSAHGVAGNEPPVAFTIACADVGEADALALQVAGIGARLINAIEVSDFAKAFALAVALANFTAPVAVAIEVASNAAPVAVALAVAVVVATVALAFKVAYVGAHTASDDAAAHWPFAIASLGIDISAFAVALKVANVTKAVARAVQGPDDFSTFALAISVANVAKAISISIQVAVHGTNFAHVALKHPNPLETFALAHALAHAVASIYESLCVTHVATTLAVALYVAHNNVAIERAN